MVHATVRVQRPEAHEDRIGAANPRGRAEYGGSIRVPRVEYRSQYPDGLTGRSPSRQGGLTEQVAAEYEPGTLRANDSGLVIGPDAKISNRGDASCWRIRRDGAGQEP